MMKKIISFFTALSMTLMLFTGIPISVSAVETSETCEHDYCGYFTPYEPTCTKRGIKRFSVHCYDCNRYFANDGTDSEWRKDPKEITEDDVFIPALGHDFSDDWSKNATNHWHICSRKNCNEVDEESRAKHSGGTATCQAKAVCEVCGWEYGEKGDHTYNTTWSTDNYSHYHACTVCGLEKDSNSHSGGTATCTKKKVCDICGQEYGGFAAHNYSTKYEYNDTQHWQECQNSGCTKTTTPTSHTLTWGHDETEHWRKCTKCDFREDDSANHNIVVWEAVEPTCKNYGWTEGLRCSVCYYSTKSRERLDKTDHTWGDWVVTTPATEETEGEKKHTCSVCDTVETETIPVTGHTFSDKWTSDDTYHWHAATCGHDVKSDEAEHAWNSGTVTTPPTEEAEGVKTFTCTICSATKTESIAQLEHTHDWSGTYQSDDSQHWKVCTKCSEAGTKETHSWDSGTVTTPPTEETKGVKTFTCTVCSATKTESIAQLEHTHDWSGEYQSDNSQHWKVCTKCSEAGTKENHSWGSGTVTTPPTEEAEGVRTYTCTVCSATKTESIAQLEHKHTYSAEWTSNETSHWHAATCGHEVTSEMAAHTEDGGTVTTPPTIENDGEKTYACSVCGYVMRTVAIPKLDEEHTHSFSPDWKHDSTNHWHECDCGAKSDNSVHIENSGVMTTEPTETSTGIMTYSCKTCGYVIRTDIISALVPEHTHSFGTDWKYDSVSHWHECECGEKSDIASHISSDWIVEIPATVEAEGVQIKKCTVCGIELDRETIEKLPNGNGDVVEDVQDTAGTNAGLVQDNTLIENVLTPEDKTEITEGHNFEIVLEVTDIRNSVSPTDVTAASLALKADEKIGIYVDLSLFKIKDSIERTPIYNTNGQIGITLTIPESIYASDRTYSIIRVHNGVAENLGGTYDKTSRKLTFYTDKFSTYAIAYTASNGGTDRPSVPSTPPTGGTTPVSPSVPVVTPTVTETTVKDDEEVISDEPYTEDVSSAAGIYENGEADNNIHYVMILIFAAAAGIAAIAAKKHFCKNNMK